MHSSVSQKSDSTPCYGEVGVHRHEPHLLNRLLWLDEDYDRVNQQGSDCGRRNYKGSCYVSGRPALSPGEYPEQTFDFYRDYGPKSDSEGDIIACEAP